MRKVRVNLTLFSYPVEVDEDELPALRSQGLLVGAARETEEDPETGQRKHPLPAAPEPAAASDPQDSSDETTALPDGTGTVSPATEEAPADVA
jgi:hypothetical protein